MRRIIDNDMLTMLFRLILGVTFIVAAYYKIVEPQEFARSIWFYHLVPGNLINLMALTLPWIELFVGLALIAGCNYRGAVLLTGLMLVMFIIALGYTVVQGIDIDCGCFKASAEATGSAWDTIWRDLVLMVMVIQLWFTSSRRWMCRN